MNILFADDHINGQLKDLFGDLKKVFLGINPACKFYTTENPQQTLGLLADDNALAQSIDMAWLDERMPASGDGIYLAEQLSEQYPHIAVVMLSAYGDYDLLKRLMEMGVCGFVDKSEVFSYGCTDMIKKTLNWRSVQIKLRAKAQINVNWQNLLQALHAKGLSWLAYDNARWLLLVKLLTVVPATTNNDLNLLLPVLQNLCESEVQTACPEFKFTKLRSAKLNTQNAEKWLNAIKVYCAKPVTEVEHTLLLRAKKQSNKGGTFTSYLSTLHSEKDKNPFHKALILLHNDRENIFKPLLKFEEIRHIKKEFLDKNFEI